MLSRLHPLPDDALPMLREKGLKKYAEVETVDHHPMGVALRYFHRSPEEVDPELGLYRTYLEVQSIELGGSAFIPTQFIGSYDPETNRVTLLTSLDDLGEEGWYRTPDFIARGWGVPEELV